ncbi:MAG: hypothetical protein ABEI99_01500 [Halobaculum sp.]
MPTRLLQVGDTRIRAASDRDTESSDSAADTAATDDPADAATDATADSNEPDPTGGLEAVRKRAVSLDADAVVFTGNLFSVTDPDTETVEPVRDCLDRFVDDELTLYYVVGARDRAGDWNPWAEDALGCHPAVEHLDTEPTDIGPEVAVFGIDNRAPEALKSFLHEADDQFVNASGVGHQLLVLSQSISPPIQRREADAQAFEVASNVNLYVDRLLAGGTPHPGEWTHDDSDFAVTYAGSGNPYWAEDDPTGVLYEVADDIRHAVVTLVGEDDPFTGGEDSDDAAVDSVTDSDDTAGPTATDSDDTTADTGSALTDESAREAPSDADPRQHAEVTRLRDFFESYREYDLGETDTETLVDLYALYSRSKSLFESRRRDIRDELEARTDGDQTLDGSFSTVEHHSYTSQSLRDEESVRSALKRADVDPDSVVETVERIDEDALTDVVEASSELSRDDVFEESTRQQIRRKEIDME